MEETAHLVDAPKEAEHRHKYSMGAGYFLGADRYDSGWKIRKVPIGRSECDELWPLKVLPTYERVVLEAFAGGRA